MKNRPEPTKNYKNLLAGNRKTGHCYQRYVPSYKRVGKGTLRCLTDILNYEWLKLLLGLTANIFLLFPANIFLLRALLPCPMFDDCLPAQKK